MSKCTCLTGWLIDWLMDFLLDPLIDWWTYWLVPRLIDWLINKQYKLPRTKSIFAVQQIVPWWSLSAKQPGGPHFSTPSVSSFRKRKSQLCRVKGDSTGQVWSPQPWARHPDHQSKFSVFSVVSDGKLSTLHTKSAQCTQNNSFAFLHTWDGSSRPGCDRDFPLHSFSSASSRDSRSILWTA